MRWAKGSIVLAILASGCAPTEETLLPPLAGVEVPSIARRQPPPPKPEPMVLIGQSDAEIREFLGAPDLVRNEDPAEIWRYGDEDCGLHLFFYQEGDLLRVTHVETRYNGVGPDTPAECLDSLRRRTGVSE